MTWRQAFGICGIVLGMLIMAAASPNWGWLASGAGGAMVIGGVVALVRR